MSAGAAKINELDEIEMEDVGKTILGSQFDQKQFIRDLEEFVRLKAEYLARPTGEPQ